MLVGLGWTGGRSFSWREARWSISSQMTRHECESSMLVIAAGWTKTPPHSHPLAEIIVEPQRTPITVFTGTGFRFAVCAH